MEQTPTTLLPVALVTASQYVKTAVREAVDRAVDTFASAVLSSREAFARSRLSAAQFLLTRHQPELLAEFDHRLQGSLEQESRREAAQAVGGLPTPSSWDSLCLVEEGVIERRLAAERMGADLTQAAQQSLSRLDGFVSSLQGLPAMDPTRNPLRPDQVVSALLYGVDRCTEEVEARRLIASEIASHLRATLAQAYEAAALELERAGVRPLATVLRPVERSSTQAPLSSRHGALAPTGSHGDTGQGVDESRNSQFSGRGSASGATGMGGMGGMGGMNTALGERLAGPMGSVIRNLVAQAVEQSTSAGAFADSGPDSGTGLPAGGLRNVIQAHRDTLRQASAGGTDFLIIDVVSILFDQILEDPRLPPRMARHISRLQLPVLRAALDDPTFFSSRRHPVRRFINRLASLGAGMDELPPADQDGLLDKVGDLVRDIMDGDFERVASYEAKLQALESFVADQSRPDGQAQAGTAALLADREQGLRQQQLFAVQLKRALQGIVMPAFVADFICHVWSQVLLNGIREGGELGPRAQDARECARELFLSVQPKGDKDQRKRFLSGLPGLMRQLNEGVSKIHWPEAAKTDFFGKLLPAHAESLRGASLSTLDFNLLVKRIEAALATPAPRLDALAIPTLTDAVTSSADSALRPFSDSEAQQIGLLQEQAVDWLAPVEQPAEEEPAVAQADLKVAGLPEPEAPEPMAGPTLADHLQVGFAYRMHLQTGWQKVRLNYVSPARSFFVFSHGSGQRQTVSMTLRMVRRLAESGRLRAFEHAYLLERATARARRQLASLSAGAAAHGTTQAAG